MPASSLCPCESGKSYADCCGRFIESDTPAPTAVALMRSRYTAYVQGNEAYLLKTWHSSSRPEKLALQESQPDKWLGLKITGTQQGESPDTEGVVEFIARYKVNGRAGRLHEISKFFFEDGQWFYKGGELLD